jgi:hypothetical protein
MNYDSRVQYVFHTVYMEGGILAYLWGRNSVILMSKQCIFSKLYEWVIDRPSDQTPRRPLVEWGVEQRSFEA